MKPLADTAKFLLMAAIAVSLYLLISGFFSDPDDEVQVELILDGDRVAYSAPGFPDTIWNVDLMGFRDKYKPGDNVAFDVHYDIRGEGFAALIHEIDQIKILLSARRMHDEEGRFRNQDAFFYSTYLTPSGLPVEGYQYYIAHSEIGGPYKTPLDHSHVVPKEEVEIDENGLRFSAAVNSTLAEDFPPGVYRFEMAFFAHIQGYWMPLHMLRAINEDLFGCTYDYETIFYNRLLLPPVTVGSPARPKAIWTLFTSLPNHGVAGVVAEEDAKDFAISTRVKLQTSYHLPCTPDRGECRYRIEPDLPTAVLHRYPHRLFEPDCSRGEVTVRVKRPDGKEDDLGTATIVSEREGHYGVLGAQTKGNAHEYNFDQFGKYSIEMAGHVFDRYGNKYDAGGTFEVWVAFPLTFATGMKPGNPLQIGKTYPISATINPPVPADVTARVTFYPEMAPDDSVIKTYKGKAQRFGYFYPDETYEPPIFDRAGEYLFDIFATYKDHGGRVYMGHMKNASIVLPEKPNMQVRGMPPFYGDLENEITSYTLNGEVNYYSSQAINFPLESGHLIYIRGNGPAEQRIQPAMSVSENSGHIFDFMKRNFAPGLLRLSENPENFCKYGSKYNIFPGPKEQIRYYAMSCDEPEFMPLLSTTTKGYSPFEYPELVNRAGYFYIASSRPGFPVFFTIGDSTIAENYWLNQYVDYGGTIGAAARGDQPGDVLWSLVAGYFADRTAGKAFYGQYSNAGVVSFAGENAPIKSAPFENPVVRFNGEDLYIYAGVGPAPGIMYETGAVKGIGSVAVPMAPHNARIEILKPDGETIECSGRANAIGNFSCSKKLVLNLPGVYRIHTEYEEKGKTGWCAGTFGGDYNVYAVQTDNPARVFFDGDIPGPVDYETPFVVKGAVEPALKRGKAYYSVVAPGLLIDEGEVGVKEGRFSMKIFPDQFGAQYPNLFGHPNLISQPFVDPYNPPVRFSEYAQLLARGNVDKKLTDTVEVTVFVQGENGRGELTTGGGKLVFRGERAIVPGAFLKHGGASYGR